MQHVVYVQASDGKPLMPTKRFGKVRRMLNAKQAHVVLKTPFTIRLDYQTETRITQNVIAGEDPGRTNIGLAAITEDAECLYLSHTATRNKDIPKNMSDRRDHRKASRRGERRKRKRRAEKCHTTFLKFRDTRMGKRPEMCYDRIQKKFHACHERYLPHYDKPVIPREIKNTEAKFLNRKHPKGWLTPTATHLLRTHVNLFRQLCRILPVTSVCIELNKFAFMALENPDAKGIDFQNGKLKGFSGPHEAVAEMQDHKCLLCGKHAIEHFHHVLPRSQGGADTVDNLAGLCLECHNKIHKDQEEMDKMKSFHSARNKKYGALSVLNQIIPYLVKELEKMFPGNVYITTGYNTKRIRDLSGIDKDHTMDAYCIAASVLGEKAYCPAGFPDAYEILQFRRHDRARIHCQHERTYKLDGKTVAKNRHKRTGQMEDSLEEWYAKQIELHGEKEARKTLSSLKVKKSKRIYNPDPKTREFFPGDTVEYHGKRYIVKYQNNKGRNQYFIGYGSQSFKAKECKLERRNAGLVYVP